MDLKVKVKRKVEEMSNSSPVFPIPDSYPADYGSDPQIHYFQVLEEARKHRNARFISFKLQKPISKDESKRKKKQKRIKWWRDAILYFRNRWPKGNRRPDEINDGGNGISSVKNRRGTYVGSISSPIYLTESRSGSSTPCRNNSRPLTPAASRKGEVEIPYVSLRDLNMEPPQFYKSVPIYLVT